MHSIVDLRADVIRSVAIALDTTALGVQTAAPQEGPSPSTGLPSPGLPSSGRSSSGLEFAAPEALWLALVLPVWWVLRAMRRRPVITFARTDLVARGPRASGFYPKLLFVLRNVVLLAFVVALARPRAATRSRTVTTEGINIVLVTDLSSSMLAQDFLPRDRLDVAKSAMRSFVASRPSDRIGLVTFAGEAVTRVPLTTDHATLLGAIDRLQVGQLDDGTAIGDAVATATNRLRHAPGKSRVMILLTDGVNNRGAVDPVTAAAVSAGEGIRIYAIGVGKKGMAPVPVDSGPSGVKIEMRPVELDETLLTKVALSTRGQYFRAQDGAALRRVYGQIDAMERSPIRATTNARYAELFRWPLCVALAVLLLELAVGAVKGPIP